MRLVWTLGHSVISGNEIANMLTCQFLGTVPTLGNSRQNITQMTKGWLFNLLMTVLYGLTGTQRQAQINDLGPQLRC